MLVLTSMRWMRQPILAQLFYICMYAVKLKSEIVTYSTSSRFQYFVLIRVIDENPFSNKMRRSKLNYNL